jgi:small subunit ribosomal protein S1
MTKANYTPVAINDIGSDEEILKAIDETVRPFNDNDIIKGTVVKIERDQVLVDVGYKTEGIVTAKELSLSGNENPEDVVSLGEEIEVFVLQKEDKDGNLILSKKRGLFEKTWREIEQIKRDDKTIKGKVIGIVRGGLIVDVGIKGFLPASLIDVRSIKDLQQFVGEEIEAKVIELDKVKNNIVLSRKALIREDQVALRSEFMKQLKKGQIRSGVISSIVSFGAFVDLGGIDGLIHVSELSWKHISNPEEVVEVGQPVTVEVLEVEEGKDRISLSLKATQEDPWQAFARTHSIGQIIPGKIIKIVQFGAFVQVDYGIEGLVHISELAARHLDKANQIVKLGEEVLVKIIDINLSRRRISFSLKQSNSSIDVDSEEFDPALYGMPTEYDEDGNYKYPEGFDPNKNEWIEGYEKERENWEAEYMKAHERWKAHKKQISEMREKDKEIANTSEESKVKREPKKRVRTMKAHNEGALAGNEELASLKEELVQDVVNAKREVSKKVASVAHEVAEPEVSEPEVAESEVSEHETAGK